MTDRSAPGAPRLTPRWPRMAWPTKKADRLASGADGEGGDAEDGGFGGDDRVSLGGGGERGADHAGGVFAGHGQHAQHADGELGEQARPPRLVEIGSKAAGVVGAGCATLALMAPMPIMATTATSEAPVGGADAARVLAHSERSRSGRTDAAVDGGAGGRWLGRR